MNEFVLFFVTVIGKYTSKLYSSNKLKKFFGLKNSFCKEFLYICILINSETLKIDYIFIIPSYRIKNFHTKITY